MTWNAIETLPVEKQAILWGVIHDIGAYGFVIGFRHPDGSFYLAGIDDMEPEFWMDMPRGPK